MARERRTNVGSEWALTLVKITQFNCHCHLLSRTQAGPMTCLSVCDGLSLDNYSGSKIENNHFPARQKAKTFHTFSSIDKKWTLSEQDDDLELLLKLGSFPIVKMKTSRRIFLNYVTSNELIIPPLLFQLISRSHATSLMASQFVSTALSAISSAKYKKRHQLLVLCAYMPSRPWHPKCRCRSNYDIFTARKIYARSYWTGKNGKKRDWKVENAPKSTSLSHPGEANGLMTLAALKRYQRCRHTFVSFVRLLM